MCVCRSGLQPVSRIRAAGVSLANGDTKPTLELVLAVVEESTKGQREGERHQLLLKGCTNHPITVNCAYVVKKVEDVW